MIEVFKTENKKTLYAIAGTKTKEEAYKKLAERKKESLATTKRKHAQLLPGYMIEKNNQIYLFETKAKPPKGATACLIAGLNK